ncbi:Cytoplasmic dynein 1 intermediate chain [Hondaea fermentalgiana]|uniref:Cytoplasmic dynein 1 intermediate chain n=1 Tax=Hondaea fermentalgiana TaxID=2315210 RepID=A0A2R5G2A5_9STRA|nr:Cytoplasmic dynein 1 intermediate chain [Hondaea fermentalgiana]|eukprot:GBG24449.1 Cytoplasmic dynein 1 intermediate chain [Hondaea fermentalgiana]
MAEVEQQEQQQQQQEEEKAVEQLQTEEAKADGQDGEAKEAEGAAGEEGKEAAGGEDAALEAEGGVATEEASIVISFPEERPEGVMPMMISIKNMEKYELKNGDGLKDTVAYKFFNKEEVLEEIRSVGFYSDFNDFKGEIADYPAEEILIIADPDEVYGQNWMICLTVEAKELMFAIIDAEARRLQEIKRKQEEEEAARLAEEEARRNVVYEDKPIVPHERDSLTALETQSEIAWLDVRPSRKLLRVEMTRKRSEFGAPIKFNDRDAEQSGLIEFRQHKDPNFELKRREQDVALQACASWTAAWIPNSPWARPEDDGAGATAAGDELDIPSMNDLFDPVPAAVGAAGKRVATVSDFDFCSENLTLEDFLGARELPRLVEAGSQTAYFRKLNATTQYEHVEMSAEEREALVEDELAEFLGKVLPSVEVALQQNETIDVFANEFHRLRSEEVSGLGNKEDNVLRELRTFTDLVYSNGRALSCVDWHPRSQNVVAVACADPLHFDQRVEVSGQERSSFILIWNFADLIHPQLVLKSPHECRCFAFNPDQPHLVAGGCTTGQIIIWDISHAQELLRRRKGGGGAVKNANAGKSAPAGAAAASSTDAGAAGNTGDADPLASETGADGAAEDGTGAGAGTKADDNEKVDSNGASIEPVEPLMISPIEHSHKRPIEHLEWLPGSMHVSTSGRVSGDVKYGSTEVMATQFITCASDGFIVIWGPRFGGSKAAKPAAADPNDPNAGDANRLAEETPWKPIFKTALVRQGSRNFGITKVALRGRIDALLDMLNRQHEHRRENSPELQEGRPIQGMGMTATGTMFSCATEEGDMMFADWLGARHAKTSARAAETSGEAGADGNNAGGSSSNNNNAAKEEARLLDDKVYWVARDHFASCLALRRSPFFPYLILSVSAHSFNIWKEDLAQPIFSSPLSTGMAHLACAEWSPTRPGVIMVGKTDGTVDIWDFVDQSHRPSVSASITAYAITSMQFRCTMATTNAAPGKNGGGKRHNKTLAIGSNEPRTEQTLRKARVAESVGNAPQGDLPQYLALGDATGNLHILDVPRNLRWRMPTEEKLMMGFFERELDRVQHVAKRKVVRDQEREAMDLASPGLLGSFDGIENDPVDENTKEYRKLVLAEEKRFQEMAEKLLKPEDLALARAGSTKQRKHSPSKSAQPKSKRKGVNEES